MYIKDPMRSKNETFNDETDPFPSQIACKCISKKTNVFTCPARLRCLIEFLAVDKRLFPGVPGEEIYPITSLSISPFLCPHMRIAVTATHSHEKNAMPNAIPL
jgi:hypothetical protein